MENPLLKLKDEVMHHLVNEVQLQFMPDITHSKDLQKIILISSFLKTKKEVLSHFWAHNALQTTKMSLASFKLITHLSRKENLKHCSLLF